MHSLLPIFREKAFKSIEILFPDSILFEKDSVLSFAHSEIKKVQQKLSPSISPFFIRLCGQSGSGKSSLNIPIIRSFFDTHQIPYIYLTVGKFAFLHPQHSAYINRPDYREKTNSFALKALTLTLEEALNAKIPVILDMTFLEPEIEYYFALLAKKNGYQVSIHCMAVPKKVSKLFIKKRQLTTGRVVYSKSADYFFSTLNYTLKRITLFDIWDKKDILTLWSHLQGRPVQRGRISNPTWPQKLLKYQGNQYVKIKKIKTILSARTYYLNSFLQSLISV